MFSMMLPTATLSIGPSNKQAARDASPPPPPKFPVYLLPNIMRPFRRRRHNSVSATRNDPDQDILPPLVTSSPSTGDSSSLSSPTDSPVTPSTPGSPLSPSSPSTHDTHHYNQGSQLHCVQPDTIRCAVCSTDFAFASQIVSKAFHGRFGRAYLVAAPENAPRGPQGRNLVNIRVGKWQTRELVTGTHTVADIFCSICQAQVGWKYINASDPEQAYKIGRFILETRRTVDHKSWEFVSSSKEKGVPNSDCFVTETPGHDIEFDSEDEDECEDIFSGTWDPVITAKRRSKKVNLRPKQN